MSTALLLEPIASSAPAGVDLRLLSSDLTLEKIRELRKEVTPNEDWASGQGKEPDWSGIVAACENALASHTKDLELANAIAEAWARTSGFDGLAAGLGLVRGLIERFWDCVHPGFEDGQIIEPIRARHVSWIGSAESFLRSVREAPLLHAGDGAPISWSQRLEALRLEDLRLTSQASWKEAREHGALVLEELEARLAALPDTAYSDAARAVDACRQELVQLEALCRERFSREHAPDLLRLRDLLDEIAAFLAPRVPTAQAPVEAPLHVAQAPDSVASDAEPARSPAASRIQTRREALTSLAEIAEFLRETEPHSPVSYLVERAVRWGQMPLEQVLKEVVKDPTVLHHIWDTLGIRPTED